MKQICVVLSLCSILLFSAAPAWGRQGNPKLPALVEDIVRNCDFFAKPWALRKYEHCSIYSVKRIADKRIGVNLIAPSGFGHSLVYEVDTMEAIYEDIHIPVKSEREAIREKSISVAGALKLAQFAISHAHFENKSVDTQEERETFRVADKTAKNLEWQESNKQESDVTAHKADIKGGNVPQKSFIAEVAGLAHDIIYATLSFPAEIIGLGQKKSPSVERIE